MEEKNSRPQQSLRIRKRAAKKDQGRCCLSLKFTKELLRDTFFKTDFEGEKKSLEEKLLAKSWVCHCFHTMSRLALTASGTPYHKTAYEAEKFPEKTNEDFVQDSKATVQTLIVCFSLLGLILDIVVWRRSKFGSLIYPLEVLMLNTIGLAPVDYGNFGELVPLMTAWFSYIFYAAPTKINTVVCILSYFIH